MFDPPLQMPLPKRQFATPTPTVTPNLTPAASRTTSSANMGVEPPVDEIREILLGQHFTPDPFSADSSATAQVTRQFSAMVLESTGDELDNFEQPQFTFDLPTMESSVSPVPQTFVLERSGNPMEKNMGVLADVTGSLTLLHQRLRSTSNASENNRGAELGLLSLSPPRTFAFGAPCMRPQCV